LAGAIDPEKVVGAVAEDVAVILGVHPDLTIPTQEVNSIGS
jgi:hypothetical protein